MNDALTQRQANRSHQVKAGDEIVMRMHHVVSPASYFGSQGLGEREFVTYGHRRGDDTLAQFAR